MNPVFELNHDPLAADPRMTALAGELRAQSQINSRDSFNRYCRTACRLWREHFHGEMDKPPARFAELLAQVERGGAGIIRTPWGGVVIELHEPPRVEKYLVIRRGGYLALETHEQKDEHLEVKEGAGLLLSRRASGQPLAVQALAPGERAHFAPGMEHCLIGTENLLVFERSVDPKGMDQDLIFLYEPGGHPQPSP